MRIPSLIFDLYYATLIAIAGVWAMLFGSTREERRAASAEVRTQNILTTVRWQQRTPRVVERNLAERLRAEMRRGRENQVSRIYADMERSP
jgi:hypothetical protein